MKRLIFVIVAAGILSCPALNAQQIKAKAQTKEQGYTQTKAHEFSAHAGGGLSSLQYATTHGSPKNGFGVQFGLGYRFYFLPEWSLVSGIELALYNSKYSSGDTPVEQQYMTTDIDGDAFEFRSTVNSFEEKQQAMFVQIPLMVQYQYKLNERQTIYVAAGGKAGIPVSGKYENAGVTLRNSGYYLEENYEYTTQEFMGFGTFTGKDYTGNLKFNAAFFISVEAGVKWTLTDALTLYTGAFFDYGLNNIRNTGEEYFVTYNRYNPRDFSVNSITESQYMQTGLPQLFTEKIRPIAVGIKVSIAFKTDGGNRRYPE